MGPLVFPEASAMFNGIEVLARRSWSRRSACPRGMRDAIRTASARNSMAQRYTSSLSKSRSGRSMPTRRIADGTVASSSSCTCSTLVTALVRVIAHVPRVSAPNVSAAPRNLAVSLTVSTEASRRASTKPTGEPYFFRVQILLPTGEQNWSQVVSLLVP